MGSYIYEMEDDLCQKRETDTLPGTSISWELQSFLPCAPRIRTHACIVSEDNKILSMGYNGFPKGCSDDEFPWDKIDEDPYNRKYFYVTHSELNAILNYRGGSLEGSKLYVTLFPCNECAKAIIQAGIQTIVYESDKYANDASTRASKRMLNAAGVRYYQYNPTGRKIEYRV